MIDYRCDRCGRVDSRAGASQAPTGVPANWIIVKGKLLCLQCVTPLVEWIDDGPRLGSWDRTVSMTTFEARLAVDAVLFGGRLTDDWFSDAAEMAAAALEVDSEWIDDAYLIVQMSKQSPPFKTEGGPG